MVLTATASSKTDTGNDIQTVGANGNFGTVYRLVLSLDWITYLLFVLILGTVAWTFRDANWVDTPGVLVLVLLAALTGSVLAKTKVPPIFLHVLVVLFGAVTAIWLGSTLIDEDRLSSRFVEMWNRVVLFYEAATTGGISTDLLPMSLIVLWMTWLLGYFGAWFLFRHSNFWMGLLFSGLPMLTVLSFLPDRYFLNFLFFIFLSMMLVIRVTMVQRVYSWQSSNIGILSINRWLTTRATLIFSVAVLFLSAVVPIKQYRSEIAVFFWDMGRTPISFFDDDFSRLLSSIPARDEQMGRFFGTSLPFTGKINFNGDVVFWTESDQANYWMSRAYSRYTSKGWFAGQTRERRIGPNNNQPPLQETEKRILTAQTVQFSFDTTRLLAGGNLDWVSREVVAETLIPLMFNLDMFDDRADHKLPEDVQSIAVQLRTTFSLPVTSFVESKITRKLSSDLMLSRVVYTRDNEGNRYVKTIRLVRRAPEFSDLVSWRFVSRLKADQSYEMNSFVSQATLGDLRNARSEYSGFITDHYLQLPDTVPQRVHDLAENLTRDAKTPLDKALAIKNYLRSDTFTYSQDIDKPPRRADGVDYFLFESKEGYSDYFASAMTVMLRSSGVPARLAAGYASGELGENATRRAVKDSDSHGWSQVYFPSYGWVDFEPTPNWPDAEPLAGSESSELVTTQQTASTPEQSPFDCPEPEELIDGLAMLVSYRQNTGINEINTPSFAQETDPCAENDGGDEVGSWIGTGGGTVSNLIALAAIVCGVVIAFFAAGAVIWKRGLGELPGERAYTKMARLATLAGIKRRPHETPIEYSGSIGQAIPKSAEGAKILGWAFASRRYGQQQITEQGIEVAWNSIRFSLLLRVLRRLIPIQAVYSRL